MITRKRPTYWIRDTTVILIGLLAMLFISVTDRKISKADEATKQDRLRVNCTDRPHDAMCLMVRGNKQ